MYKTYPEIDELLRQVETKCGFAVKTTNDFESLSKSIESTTRELLSSSTLKRLWGYVGDHHKPRFSTLEILCRYIGAGSFDNFRSTLSALNSSMFFSNRNVASKDLSKDTTIEVGWQPNRYLLLRHLGCGRFEVEEAQNSKLAVGDRFTCAEFIEGHQLCCTEVEHDGSVLPLYQAGLQGGLTVVNVIG